MSGRVWKTCFVSTCVVFLLNFQTGIAAAQALFESTVAGQPIPNEERREAGGKDVIVFVNCEHFHVSTIIET